MNMEKTFEIKNQNKTIELPMATDQCLLHIFFSLIHQRNNREKHYKISTSGFFFVEMKKKYKHQLFLLIIINCVCVWVCIFFFSLFSFFGYIKVAFFKVSKKRKKKKLNSNYGV